MCGIAGIIVLNDEQPPVAPERLHRMNSAMVHRGPDDEGLYLSDSKRAGLSARRLSIIDLAGGHQPLSNEDGTVWACQNGELYNFHEIRRDLETKGHTFRTRTDTEILVHLYEERGADCTESINGMFAFALWDEKNRRGVVVRDRLGIKPLYYTVRDNELVFASELGALTSGLRDPHDLEIDLESLDDYFALGYISSPRSIFKGIRKLSPGHRLRIEKGRVFDEAYWVLSEKAVSLGGRSHRALREETRELLSDSVRRRLIADVPLGVFLSGGLDSAAVTALMAQAGHRPLRTFTIGFEEESFDETPLAEITARRYATDHLSRRLSPEAIESLPEIAACYGEPFADASMLPTYWVSKLARERVAVCLSGEGGDEVFAGYETYSAYKMARLYRRLAPGPIGSHLIPALVNFLPVSHRKMSFDYKARKFIRGALASPEEAHYIYKEIIGRTAPARKRDLYAGALRGQLESETSLDRFRNDFESPRNTDVLNRLLCVDASTYLPDNLLMKVDHASMAHSLEVRTPFLDHRLVEFAFGIPGDCKMPGRRRKFLLREAVKDLIPTEILQGRKQGFSIPLARWLHRGGRMADLRNDLLSPASLEATGFLNAEGVETLIKEHDGNRCNHARPLWSLMIFILWHRRWRV